MWVWMAVALFLSSTRSLSYPLCLSVALHAASKCNVFNQKNHFNKYTFIIAPSSSPSFDSFSVFAHTLAHSANMNRNNGIRRCVAAVFLYLPASFLHLAFACLKYKSSGVKLIVLVFNEIMFYFFTKQCVRV